MSSCSKSCARSRRVLCLAAVGVAPCVSCHSRRRYSWPHRRASVRSYGSATGGSSAANGVAGLGRRTAGTSTQAVERIPCIGPSLALAGGIRTPASLQRGSSEPGKADILAALQARIPNGAPVAIVEIPGKGRGMVATRRIDANEAVVWEEPVAWELEESCRSSHCAACLRPASTGTALRACSRCSIYLLCHHCSEHPDCDVVAAAVGAGKGAPSDEAMQALRVARVVLLAGAEAVCIESLCWHRMPRNLALINFANSFHSPLRDVIHGAYARIAANGFNIRSREGSPIARALFLLSSMCNHDCNPNVTQAFRSKSPTEMSMIARCIIEPGEEICGSYVEVKKPRSERRAELYAGWRFDCSCARCARGAGATGDERYLFGVVCSACGALIAEHEGERCGCGRDDALLRQRTVNAAMTARTKAQELFQSGRKSGTLNNAKSVDSAFELLQHSLGLFRKTLCRLHHEVFSTLGILIAASRFYGRTVDCELLSKEFSQMAADRDSWMSGRPSQTLLEVACDGPLRR